MADQQETLKTLLSIFDKGKQVDEFLAMVPQIMQLFKELKVSNEEERGELSENWKRDFARLEEQVRTIIKGRDGVDGTPGSNGLTPTRAELLALIKPLIPKKAKDGERGLPGLDGLPPSDEKLKSLIEPLIPKVEDIAAKVPQRVQTPAKSYQINKADVSAQCDGANKTFTVGGSHFGIMGVFGTDFPQVYRPIIDYTETRTGVLLTSAVPAPNSGATLIIQFLK